MGSWQGRSSAPSLRLVQQRWERRRMTRKALARPIAEPYLTSQQRREAPAPPHPEGLARILAGCFVARQSKTTAGILLPRAAHPAKIRSSAAIRASDLVHQELEAQSIFLFNLRNPPPLRYGATGSADNN